MAARVPKFPYPIHVNINNFVTIKLAEDNFLLWQAQFHRFLRSQELFGFVNGEISPPSQKLRVEVGDKEVEEQNPNYGDWMRTDQLISSWISGAVSENILGLIIGLETSYEVWQTLLNRFTQKSVAREFELRGKLQACQKRGRPLSDYLREYKLICDQLNAIGKPVDEITKVFGVLEGLGSEYENFRTTMYCLKPQPDYDEVISQLERFETRLQNYFSSQYNLNCAYYGQRNVEREQRVDFDSEVVRPNFAFVGQRGNNRFFENRGGRNYGRGGRGYVNRGRGYGYQGRNQSYRSFDSNQDLEVQAYKQQINNFGSGQGFRPYAGASQRYQDVKSYPSPNSSIKNIQDEKATEGVRLACQICKRPGHDALRCWYRFDNSFQGEDIPTALTAMHLEDPKGNEWYPDTGATAHITANPGPSNQHDGDARKENWGSLQSGPANNRGSFYSKT